MVDAGRPQLGCSDNGAAAFVDGSARDQVLRKGGIGRNSCHAVPRRVAAVTARGRVAGRDAAAGVVSTVTPAVVPAVDRRRDRTTSPAGRWGSPVAARAGAADPFNPSAVPADQNR
jgi:hypothetical protein